MSKRRVVVTGLGWVTSLGLSVSEVYDQLLAGTSGIRSIQSFDTSEYNSRIGGEVLDWTGGPHLDRREAKRLDKFAQFAMSASIDAVNDSGLEFDKEDSFRCGVSIGSGVGGIEEFESGCLKLHTKGPSRVSPFVVPKLMVNAASGNVSMHYGLRGPNIATATACATAAHAIGVALDAVRYGQADIMVTGGSEAALTPLGLACFDALKALSSRNDEPTKASRPFDKDRDGFVLSEGAGIVVLEEYEHAKARGAEFYCELLGYGQSADASHITAPDEQGRGAAYAMTQAVKDSGLQLDQIDYINTHGTSTGLGDIAETKAIKLAFGDHAHKMNISSTKSMTGHCLGATGGIETAVCAKAIKTGKLPPTINLDNPDPECDLDYIPHTAREADTKYVLNNSFGFGGHNVTLAMGKV